LDQKNNRIEENQKPFTPKIKKSLCGDSKFKGYLNIRITNKRL